jgi:uncharacterized protein (DUF4415 family)
MAALFASFQRAKRQDKKAPSIIKAEYDLSKMQSRKNRNAGKLKKCVSMRLSEEVVDYFKGIASKAGVPY